MNITDFTTDETTFEQQLLDVKAYAAANAKRYGMDLVATLTDAKLQEVIGKRKNSRGAIKAVYEYIKPLDDARKLAAEKPAQVAVAEVTPDKAAVRKEKRRVAQKARRAAKRAAKA